MHLSGVPDVPKTDNLHSLLVPLLNSQCSSVVSLKTHKSTSVKVALTFLRSGSLNNAHLLFPQEENEIPSSVFVKDPPPFPRDEILEEGDELAPGAVEGNLPQEGGLQTIDLSSDEDVGLEAELEEEEVWPHDLENMEKSRAEKLKRSSLKKVRGQTDERAAVTPLSRA